MNEDVDMKISKEYEVVQNILQTFRQYNKSGRSGIKI